MNKKHFQKIIIDNADNFGGLTIGDATIVSGNYHSCIQIYWKTGIKRTWIQTIRARSSSLKAKELLAKYLKWVPKELQTEVKSLLN